MADNVVKHPASREWKAAKLNLLRPDWPTWTRPPDSDIRYGLRALRARARHEAQNSDHARGFLRELKSNVIGPDGVGLQSKAKLANGKPAPRLRAALEDSWREWGQAGNCEVTGCLTWCDEQQRFIETVGRDGEALYRVLRGWDNRWRFAIQAIDPEALDVDYSEDLGNGRFVVMGVEIDRWRRPVAYHLIEENPIARSYGTHRNRTRTRVPADEIIHCFLPEWVWQTRGVPWMATALKRLTDLTGYEESAVVAARAGAAKMGFYEQDPEAQSLMRDDGTTEPGALADGDEQGQLYQGFDPGSIGVLPPGYKFNGWNPTYPHAEHGNFVKAVLRGVATGLGVSYNSLANDLEGVNYSSLRQGALSERAAWQTIQKWAIGCFHQRVFSEWLATALPVGAVAFNGRPIGMEREQELARVSWQPRRWKWVDPEKEAKAAKLEIEMRTRSISDVIRERGADPDEVWEEIRLERARLNELGISPSEAAAKATSPPSPIDGTEDTDDDDD